jgi:hypothetical protein
VALSKPPCLLLQPLDPWRLRLERVRGTTGLDGLERISRQTLMDILEVPQRQRAAGAHRHLAKLMAELGWTAVRVRDLTRVATARQCGGLFAPCVPMGLEGETVAPPNPSLTRNSLPVATSLLAASVQFTAHVGLPAAASA